MNFPLRGVCYALLIGLLVAGAGYLCWNAREPVQDAWPDAQEDLPDQEVRRREALDARRADLLRTWKVKDQICRELIARQLTLREAVAQFRKVDGKALHRETYARYLRLSFSGASEEERLCRKVIQHALELVSNRPGVQVALLKRLETELKEHLHEGSTRARREG
jgi:hypothetical protein